INTLQPLDSWICVSFRQSQKKALGAFEGASLWEVDSGRPNREGSGSAMFVGSSKKCSRPD
ncbi:hypothetical protein, partial [Burkholderia diffusa]|uniref:hypothetical protein n=1 Tax=Burkholderia diffusa TaxID=488732 RepID=UPI002ABDA238